MKTLKRLDLKKCTELKSAEMRQIVGGDGVAEVTCAPEENCGQFCQTPDNRIGDCKKRDLPHTGGFECICVPWPK